MALTAAILASSAGGLAYVTGALPIPAPPERSPVLSDLTAQPVSPAANSLADRESEAPGQVPLRGIDYARLLGSVFQDFAPATTLPSREPKDPPKLEPSAKANGVVPLGQAVPLPVPRPAEEQAARPAQERAPAKVAALPAPVEDGRSFLDKLLGTAPPAPDTANLGPGTAVYDISARLVVLPNGEKLEAHSGLRENLDDPRQVSVRMRGPTPPGTYELTERERLFHGVRALRLTPVGGSAAVHGRDGLLAHTYMLGPNGDSNGCVSFKDYDRFLQAYLKGEVKRLVVVAGSGSPRRFAGADSSASSPR